MMIETAFDLKEFYYPLLGSNNLKN
jgi:hypothetical protein